MLSSRASILHHSPAEGYREAVKFIKEDPLVFGCLGNNAQDRFVECMYRCFIVDPFCYAAKRDLRI